MEPPSRSAAPTPAASVVTTVYNRAHSLARAMNSVLEQSFTDFEYLVVDDGSTDGSANIADGFGDPRVRVIREPHRGRAAALNTAFAACRGEFILIQDSDDIALPGRFEKQIAFLREHPDVGMLGCQIHLVDSERGTTRHYRVPCLHDEILFLMPLTSALPFCASCIRKSVVPFPAPFDETMQAAEDYDLQLRILAITRLHNLDETLQQKTDMPDSLGITHRASQERLTRERSLRFLDEQMESQNVFGSLDVIRFQKARVEYYYGDIATARLQLLASVMRRPMDLARYRYLLPTLLGARFLHFLRKKRLSRASISTMQQIPAFRKHLLP